VLSADGQQLQGWITSQNLIAAVARQISAAPAATREAQLAAGWAAPGRETAGQAPDPLPGYQVLEVTIPGDSPAAGHPLGEISWPPGFIPVTILDRHILRDPDPGITVAAGDRVNLLTRTPAHPEPPPAGPGSPPAARGATNADGERHARS
jgi:hypothetical protein